MMPLPATPKRSWHASVTWRKASLTLVPGSPNAASRRRLDARASGSIAMGRPIQDHRDGSAFRGCALAELDDGLRVQTYRAGLAWILVQGPVSLTVRFDQPYAVGQMLLNRAENFAIYRIEPTAMPINHGLCYIPDLDMTVLRETHEQGPGPVGADGEALCQQSRCHSDLLASRQRIPQVVDLSLQLGHSGKEARHLDIRASLCVL